MKKKCPDCNKELLEVKKALWHNKVSSEYPKSIVEPNLKRQYNEYRFFCRKCKKEWIYNTRPDCRWFEEVPPDAQLKYSEKKQLLVLNRNAKEKAKKKIPKRKSCCR